MFPEGIISILHGDPPGIINGKGLTVNMLQLVKVLYPCSKHAKNNILIS